MAVNKYRGNCAFCGGVVAAKAGKLVKKTRRGPRGGMWGVAHLNCAASGSPEVMTVTTSGGTFTRNRRGRCEDAPCCGCCTI